MAANNVTYKVYVDKIGGRQVDEFVGQPGDLFYDPGAGEIRLSDGLTPGGVNTTVSSELSDDFARAHAAAAFEKANAAAQDSFVTFHVATQNSVTATSNADTLTFAAGPGVSIVTDAGNNTLTLSANSMDDFARAQANAAFDLANVRAQNAFSSITILGQGTLAAESNSDSVILSPGAGIELAGTDNTITIRSSVNSFSTISVTGQSNVVADSNTDTLTLSSGNGISVTTNSTTDTVTISAANSVDQFARDRSNGAVALTNTKQVLIHTDGIQVTAANTTSVQTMKTVTIPGGSMGPNGWVEIIATWTCSGVDNKSLWIRVLNPSGHLINGFTLTTRVAFHQAGIILNRSNTNAQITPPTTLDTFYGASATGNVNTSHAINTDSDWTLYFSVLKNTATDRVTLEHTKVLVQYRD